MMRAIAATVFTVGLVLGCGEPALLRQTRKERLVEEMRSAVLASAVAEKGAVMAVTDDDSRALAVDSRASSETVDRKSAELRTLVDADGREPEVAKLAAFDSVWLELQRIDRRLLDLATQNTNLKAAGLFSREGREVIIRFVEKLAAIAKETEDPAKLRTIAGCQVSALRSLATVLIHIPSSEDAEMSKLESTIAARNEEVDRGLATLRSDERLPREEIAEVSKDWSDYLAIAEQGLKLSRENSNVVSRDVSLNDKPRALKKVLLALDELQAVTGSPKPSR